MMTPASVLFVATLSLSSLAGEWRASRPVQGSAEAVQSPPAVGAPQQQPDTGRSPEAELELGPAPNYADGPPWWRGILIFLILPIVLVLAGVLGIRRWLRARARGESEDEDNSDMPLLVFPIRSEAPQIAGKSRLQPEFRPRTEPPADRRVAVTMVTDGEAANGTLQLLPGRLEVVNGDQPKEIRFVKLPGTPVVTFGRGAGEPHTHVQVESPTVSRLHAQMRFEHGRWHITNLSGTNPVVVNGQPMNHNGNERMLHDGDQVEMGEVTFRFHSR